MINLHKLIKQDTEYLVKYAMPVMVFIMIALSIFNQEYKFAGLYTIMFFVSLIIRNKFKGV